MATGASGARRLRLWLCRPPLPPPPSPRVLPAEPAPHSVRRWRRAKAPPGPRTRRGATLGLVGGTGPAGGRLRPRLPAPAGLLLLRSPQNPRSVCSAFHVGRCAGRRGTHGTAPPRRSGRERRCRARCCVGPGGSRRQAQPAVRCLSSPSAATAAYLGQSLLPRTSFFLQWAPATAAAIPGAAWPPPSVAATLPPSLSVSPYLP